MCLSIETKLNDLENQFRKFESNREQTEQIKTDQFNTGLIEISIDQALINNEHRIRDEINNQRELLLAQLRHKFHDDLTVNFKATLCFEATSTGLVESLGICLIGNLFYVNEFVLLKRLMYLNFMQISNEMRDLQKENNPVVNFRVGNLIDNATYRKLTGHHLLVYIQPSKEEAYLEIINNKSNVLRSLKISTELIYREAKCFGNRIIAAFYHRIHKVYQFYLYDLKLNQLAFRSFDYNVKLISINDLEILCWTQTTQILLSLDHKLNDRKMYGQTSDKTEPFYFGNGTLIDVNKNLILFYYNYVHSTEEDCACVSGDEVEHFVKILSRHTGQSIGLIRFQFEYFSRLFKLDMNDTILYKPHQPNNALIYYQQAGNEKINLTSNRFRNIDSFRLTRSNQVVIHNRQENKVEII